MLAAKSNVVPRDQYVRAIRSNLPKSNLDNSVQIAQTRDELEQAFSLVYKEYLRAGYVRENTSSKMIVNIHNLSPETKVWIVKAQRMVVSTLTQVFDSPLRLPMDEAYERELDALRLEGRRIVEISALATYKEYQWQNVYMPLLRSMLHYAFSCEATDVCIAVNPKHVRFYKNVLLFEDLGGKRYYPKVNAPSVALRLDLNTIEERFKRVYGDSNFYQYFFRCNEVEDLYGKKTSQVPKIMDKNMIEYFFMKKNKILQKLPYHKIKYFQRCYPAFNFNQLFNNVYIPALAGFPG